MKDLARFELNDKDDVARMVERPLSGRFVLYEDALRLAEENERLRKALEDPGVTLIAEERERQTQEEGWSAEHDDSHQEREMAKAAAAYALYDVDPLDGAELWPWSDERWKPGAPLKNLRRAGALIAAEIGRLIRSGQEVPRG